MLFSDNSTVKRKGAIWRKYCAYIQGRTSKKLSGEYLPVCARSCFSLALKRGAHSLFLCAFLRFLLNFTNFAGETKSALFTPIFVPLIVPLTRRNRILTFYKRFFRLHFLFPAEGIINIKDTSRPAVLDKSVLFFYSPVQEICRIRMQYIGREPDGTFLQNMFTIPHLYGTIYP